MKERIYRQMVRRICGFVKNFNKLTEPYEHNDQAESMKYFGKGE